jgi:hypothetical protein
MAAGEGDALPGLNAFGRIPPSAFNGADGLSELCHVWRVNSGRFSLT